MSILEDLRAMLIAHNIDVTAYTDQILNSFISEARLLVGEDFMFDHTVEEYDPNFDDDCIMVGDYPVKEGTVVVTLDDEVITPTKITSEGIIYLPSRVNGHLSVRYTVGLSGEDINQYLLPIVVYMIREKEGQNISSINEGDISISYDTSNGVNTQMSQLIQDLKHKYSGRACWI